MWSKIRLTVVVAMLAFPAIAATDDDLTNKCVNDWKWNAITGVHFTMLKGGMLEGYRDVGMGRVYLSGNWEVVKGILHLRTSTQDASGPSCEVSIGCPFGPGRGKLKLLKLWRTSGEPNGRS